MDMKKFFEEQKNKIERAFNASYQEAVRLKGSVSTYVDDKQKKLTEDVTNYVESVKEGGRKVADTWSYLPIEEPGARMLIPEMSLSVPAAIARNDYYCQTHVVVSQGYLLSVHRIFNTHYREVSTKTVLLQHGLFGSSADWILNGPGKALAYVLVDAGYDVWMSNFRGNRYAKEHVVYKNDSKSFWNFSWHDVALFDIPAIIDYIRKIKIECDITYIGHSMGSTILFAMLTLRPEYNKILKAAFALAPVAYLTNLKSPVKTLAPLASNVAYIEMLWGSHEFLPKDSLFGKITSSCEVDTFDSSVCKSVIFYICGTDEAQFNKELLPVYLANLGTDTSWKTIVHFAQEVVAGGKFQQFDYGKTDNMRVYDTETPPEYDLRKISLPIKLFWAENDLLSTPEDVQLLYEKLPPSKEIYRIEEPAFSHLDYLWAIDAPILLNEEIMHSLERVFSS